MEQFWAIHFRTGPDQREGEGAEGAGQREAGVGDVLLRRQHCGEGVRSKGKTIILLHSWFILSLCQHIFLIIHVIY